MKKLTEKELRLKAFNLYFKETPQREAIFANSYGQFFERESDVTASIMGNNEAEVYLFKNGMFRKEFANMKK